MADNMSTHVYVIKRNKKTLHCSEKMRMKAVVCVLNFIWLQAFYHYSHCKDEGPQDAWLIKGSLWQIQIGYHLHTIIFILINMCRYRITCTFWTKALNFHPVFLLKWFRTFKFTDALYTHRRNRCYVIFNFTVWVCVFWYIEFSTDSHGLISQVLQGPFY